MAADTPMQRGPISPRPRSSWIGFVLAAAGAVVTLWFLQRILTALLLLFLIIVVSMALAVPVAFLRRRGLGKRLAPALVLFLFVASLGLIGWLVIPRVADQVIVLVERLPDLVASMNVQLADLLDRHPELQGLVAGSGGTPDLSPAAFGLFQGVGNFSLGLLGALALTIIFLSGVISVVSNPKPMLRAYIASLPVQHRYAGVRAYRRCQRSIAGWTKATLIIGIIEFIAVFIVLTLLEVPAPWSGPRSPSSSNSSPASAII
jgi:predicted PurR-regulated permease PerM